MSCAALTKPVGGSKVANLSVTGLGGAGAGAGAGGAGLAQEAITEGISRAKTRQVIIKTVNNPLLFFNLSPPK